MSLALRAVAIVGALVAGLALVLQAQILIEELGADGMSWPAALWRFFAYFTILTNALVFLVFVRAAWRAEDRGGLNAPVTELMAVASILFVCAVYNVLLAPRWDPQGLQKVVDLALHDAVPALFALFWLLRPRGLLKWRDALVTATWPVAYCAYGLARGAADGFYPYFFMDPTRMAWPQLALNVAGLAALFVAGALLIVTLDSALAPKPKI